MPAESPSDLHGERGVSVRYRNEKLESVNLIQTDGGHRAFQLLMKCPSRVRGQRSPPVAHRRP